jgi:hypothetical protein
MTRRFNDFLFRFPLAYQETMLSSSKGIVQAPHMFVLATIRVFTKTTENVAGTSGRSDD